MPADLKKALKAHPEARAHWDATTIARVDRIHWVELAKQAKTRAQRVASACDMLASGKRRVCCFDPSGSYSKALLIRPDEVIVFPFGLSLSKPAAHGKALRQVQGERSREFKVHWAEAIRRFFSSSDGKAVTFFACCAGVPRFERSSRAVGFIIRPCPLTMPAA